MNIFSDIFDIQNCLRETKEKGYFFSNGCSEELLNSLQKEIKTLNFEYGDHINHPINDGKKYRVTQSHERYYKMFNDPTVPCANLLCKLLKKEITKVSDIFPELENWQPYEIGYQKYRDKRDFISPHRDRWSDRKLSVTYTVTGSAKIKIYKSLTEPVDYKFIEQIDEFQTIPGSIMFLRAPGFGNGLQVIHEVLPPDICPRYILNLRTRDILLKGPSE